MRKLKTAIFIFLISNQVSVRAQMANTAEADSLSGANPETVLPVAPPALPSAPLPEQTPRATYAPPNQPAQSPTQGMSPEAFQAVLSMLAGLRGGADGASATYSRPNASDQEIDPASGNYDPKRGPPSNPIKGGYSGPNPEFPKGTTAEFPREELSCQDLNNYNCDKRSKSALTCMVCNNIYEARNQAYHEKVAIGRVVLARVHLEKYPDSVCGVIYANNGKSAAFSWTFENKDHTLKCDNGLKEAIAAAKEALVRGPGNYTHYYNPRVPGLAPWTREANCHPNSSNSLKERGFAHIFCVADDPGTARPAHKIETDPTYYPDNGFSRSGSSTSSSGSGGVR